MKTILPSLLCLASLLSAQEPPKDPFIKEAKKNSAPPPAAAIEDRTNIALLVETFTLPQSLHASLLAEEEGREKLHPRVLAAVKDGTATLDAFHFVRTRSGTRSRLHSSEEFIFPVDWNTAAPETGLQYPKSFEMQPMGDVFEFEPVFENDGAAISVNSSFTRARFHGFRPAQADRTKPGAVVASISRPQVLSSVRMLPGIPSLLGSHSHEGGTLLVFGTPQLLRIEPPAQPVSKGAGNFSLTPRIVSLDRKTAWELLRQHPDGGPQLAAALQKLLASKQAVLEHISTLTGTPGTRVVHDSGGQFYYGTEFAPPFPGLPASPAVDEKTPAQRAVPPNPASVTAFECRQLGFRCEMEPVLTAHQTDLASINLSVSFTHHNGDVQDEHWSTHYPQLPLFIEQNVVTSVLQTLGSTILVGTLSPPGETGINGRKDEARAWLLLLETVME